MPRFVVISHVRSGSCCLANLLRCHYDIRMLGEIVNVDDFGVFESNEKLCEHVREQFRLTSSAKSNEKKFVGFKLQVDQIRKQSIEKLDHFLRSIKIDYVIVLWREDFIKTLASKLTAEKTGVWYSNEPQPDVKLEISTETILKYWNELRADWAWALQSWPLEIKPIFIMYENLILDPQRHVREMLSKMSIASEDELEFKSETVVANTLPMHEKITNWSQIPVELKSLKLDIQDMFYQILMSRTRLRKDLWPLVPAMEPWPPAENHGSFLYPISEPFVPPESLTHVVDAIHFKHVSSFSIYPRYLTDSLRQVFDTPVALACSSGFTALVLALQSCDISRDDEVICPSFTMIAVANAITFVGARPVFVDNAPSVSSYNPSWSLIEPRLTSRTRAVIICHTYGVIADDIETIVDECRRRGVFVIEDISESMGGRMRDRSGRERYLGSFGDYACASMYANKIVHAGDGGFVLAKDISVGARLESLVNHGFTRSFHFVHLERCINGKINGLGAAMALGCLHNLSHIMSHRAEMTKIYRKSIADLTEIRAIPQSGIQDSPWVFGLECSSRSQRDALRLFLARHGIDTRNYFFPLHLQPAYYSEHDHERLVNSERLGSTGFYLPLHSNLTRQDVLFICSRVRQFFNAPDLENPAVEARKLVNPAYVAVSMTTFRPFARQYDVATRKTTTLNFHPYIEAVLFNIRFDMYLHKERWDTGSLLLDDLNQFLDLTRKDHPSIEKHFRDQVKYLQANLSDQTDPIEPEWLSKPIDLERHRPVSTTTNQETCRVLSWLIERHKPENILELGVWFGHNTILMAEEARRLGLSKCRIWAVDQFTWQIWMNSCRLDDSRRFEVGESFKHFFEEKVQPFGDSIEIVEWDIEAKPQVPDKIKTVSFDLVVFDFARESHVLEQTWTIIKPMLVPRRTVFVLNSLNFQMLPFLNKFRDELKSYIKPNDISKVFIYMGKQSEDHLIK